MSQDRSTNPHPAILLVGFDVSVLPEDLKEKIRSGLQLVEEKAKEAGVRYTFYGMKPEGWKDPLLDILKSTKFDGIVIGNGIRSNMGQTHLFEQIIDAIHTHSPQTVIMFNTSPPDSLDAIKRWFPAINYNSGNLKSEVVTLNSK